MRKFKLSFRSVTTGMKMSPLLNVGHTAMALLCLFLACDEVLAPLNSRPVYLPPPLEAYSLSSSHVREATVFCTGSPIATQQAAAAEVPHDLREDDHLDQRSWRVTTFRVDAVLRGESMPEVIRVVHALYKGWPPHPVAREDADDRRFLLLLDRVDGNLFLLPPAGGELSLVSNSVVAAYVKERGQLQPQAEADRVDAELAAVVASGTESQAAGVLLSTRRWRFDAPLLHAQVTQLHQSTRNIDLWALALMWLISRESAAALRDVPTYYEKREEFSDAVKRFVDVPDAIYGNFRHAKFFPQMLALSDSADVELRRCCIHVMRSMAIPECAPVLAKALDSPDDIIRYNAMMGLHELRKRADDRPHYSWAPSVPLFQQDPESYISLWKRWWASEGKDEYPTLESVLEAHAETIAVIEDAVDEADSSRFASSPPPASPGALDSEPAAAGSEKALPDERFASSDSTIPWVLAATAVLLATGLVLLWKTRVRRGGGRNGQLG